MAATYCDESAFRSVRFETIKTAPTEGATSRRSLAKSTPISAKTREVSMATTQDKPTLRPDDPRHGTNAGYVAGCRCEYCCDGRYREGKERALYRHRFGSCRIEHDKLAAVLEPWLKMGVTLSAICEAAGFANRTDLAPLYYSGGQVNRATYNTLASVVEDDLKGTATVPADLTRKRIYSLMAAGHALSEMPIHIRGNWRKYERVTIASARDIRDHFQRLEGSMGKYAQTAARARNAGHEPPLAWDDPGTLAWPNGAPHLNSRTDADANFIDEVKVERVLAGVVEDCTPEERIQVVERWDGSLNELARLTGWNVHRIKGKAA